MQSRPENTSPEQTNHTDYRFSTGATLLFTTARLMDWVGLTNLSFYLDASLLLLLGTRAAKDLTSYGPAKALEETKQLGQNSVQSVQNLKASAVSMFNDCRGAKKKAAVVNNAIEEVEFTASPALK